MRKGIEGPCVRLRAGFEEVTIGSLNLVSEVLDVAGTMISILRSGVSQTFARERQGANSKSCWSSPATWALTAKHFRVDSSAVQQTIRRCILQIREAQCQLWIHQQIICGNGAPVSECERSGGTYKYARLSLYHLSRATASNVDQIITLQPHQTFLQQIPLTCSGIWSPSLPKTNVQKSLKM